VELKGRIDHDDRKPLSRWLQSQQRYATLEAQHLLTLPRAVICGSRPISHRLGGSDFCGSFYTLLWKRCLVADGPAGTMCAADACRNDDHARDRRPTLKNEGNTSHARRRDGRAEAKPSDVEASYVRRALDG